MQSLLPYFRFRSRPFLPLSSAIFGGLAAVLVAMPISLAMSQTAPKSEERLTAEPDALSESSIATTERDAWRRITAPLAPTRLSLVLAPSAVDPGETVFIDVYLQPEGDGTTNAGSEADGTARLTDADRSRLAGTVAFTEADAIGEEEYFVVNVPPGMRFETGAAIVTLTLSGASSPLENSAVELRQANLLR